MKEGNRQPTFQEFVFNFKTEPSDLQNIRKPIVKYPS